MLQSGEFVKVDILYEEEQIAISSINVNTVENRVILFGENFDLIPHQSIVDIAGYYEDGLVIMSGVVTLSTESQINLDIRKADDKQNRRKYLRVKVHKRAELVRAYSMGKNRKSYAINELIETRDVNLGGIGFYSNRKLLKKQKVNIDCGFLKPGFFARAEVRRIEKGSFPSGYKYKYGCVFIKKNNEEERIICEYVFRVQIENHKKLIREDDKRRN